MREKWARRIALLTGLLVLLLAALFAWLQNSEEPIPARMSEVQLASSEQTEPAGLDSKRVTAGQQIYKQQMCSRCHSIDGQGNSRNPLDGVGARRTALELRDWVIGADVLHAELSTYISGVKQAYRKLPDEDLKSLVIYMQSLRF